MRIFLVLICSLALAFAASGTQEQKKEKKPAPKKGAAPAAHVSQPKAKPVGKPTGAGKPTGVSRSAETHKAAGAGKPTGLGKPAKTGKVAGTGKPTGIGKPAETGKATGAGKPAKAATATTAGKFTATGNAKGKPFKAQHFNLPTKTRPTKVAAVNFQQGRHIQGSQNWQGSRYTVFQLFITMARQELVERPLQPGSFRIRWMVCLERGILDPGLGLRSKCILRL